MGCASSYSVSTMKGVAFNVQTTQATVSIGSSPSVFDEEERDFENFHLDPSLLLDANDFIIMGFIQEGSFGKVYCARRRIDGRSERT